MHWVRGGSARHIPDAPQTGARRLPPAVFNAPFLSLSPSTVICRPKYQSHQRNGSCLLLHVRTGLLHGGAGLVKGFAGLFDRLARNVLCRRCRILCSLVVFSATFVATFTVFTAALSSAAPVLSPTPAVLAVSESDCRPQPTAATARIITAATIPGILVVFIFIFACYAMDRLPGYGV